MELLGAVATVSVGVRREVLTSDTDAIDVGAVVAGSSFEISMSSMLVVLVWLCEREWERESERCSCRLRCGW